MGYSFYTKLYKKINGIPPDVYVYVNREEWGGTCTKLSILLPQVYGVGEVVKKKFICNLHSVVGYSEISLFS